MMSARAIAIAVALAAAPAGADLPRLAPTPPMSWGSWYGLECRVDAAAIREVAEALVRTGLAAAGYRSVNLDDCWATARGSNGSPQADTRRCPGGLAPVGRMSTDSASSSESIRARE